MKCLSEFRSSSSQKERTDYLIHKYICHPRSYTQRFHRLRLVKHNNIVSYRHAEVGIYASLTVELF